MISDFENLERGSKSELRTQVCKRDKSGGK